MRRLTLRGCCQFMLSCISHRSIASLWSVLRSSSFRSADRRRMGAVIDSNSAILCQNPSCDRRYVLLDPSQRRGSQFQHVHLVFLMEFVGLSMVVVNSRRPSTNFWWAISRIGPPRLPNTSARINLCGQFGMRLVR